MVKCTQKFIQDPVIPEYHSSPMNSPADSATGEDRRALSEQSFLIRFKSSFRSRQAKEAALSPPSGFNFTLEGNLVVADDFNHRIQIYDREFNPILDFGGKGKEPGRFHYPKGIGVDRAGNLYVADSWNHRIQKFDPQGKLLLAFGACGEGPAELNEPYDVHVDVAGRIIVVERYNHRIQFFTPEGESLGWIGTRATVLEEQLACIFETPGHLLSPPVFEFPTSIATDSLGNFYVSDSGNHRIVKFDAQWNETAAFGEKGSGAGQFLYPLCVAVTENDLLAVADLNNDRVQIITATGQFLCECRDTETAAAILSPALTAVSPDGDLLVGLTFDTRILTFELPRGERQVLAERSVEMHPAGPESLYHLGKFHEEEAPQDAVTVYRSALRMISGQETDARGDRKIEAEVILRLAKLSQEPEADFDESLAVLSRHLDCARETVIATHAEWERAAIEHNRILFAEQRSILQQQDDPRAFNRELFQAEKEDKTLFRKLRRQFYAYREAVQRIAEYLGIVLESDLSAAALKTACGFLDRQYRDLCETVNGYLDTRETNEAEMLQSFGEIQEQAGKLDAFLSKFNSNRRILDLLRQFHFEFRAIMGNLKTAALRFAAGPEVQQTLRGLFAENPGAELLPKILLGYQEDWALHSSLETALKELIDTWIHLPGARDPMKARQVRAADFDPVPYDSENLDFNNLVQALLVEGGTLEATESGLCCGGEILTANGDGDGEPASRLLEIHRNQAVFAEKASELFQQLEEISLQKLQLESNLKQIHPQDKKSPITIQNNITLVEYQISLIRRMILTLEINEANNLLQLITGCGVLVWGANRRDSEPARDLAAALESSRTALEEQIRQGLKDRKSRYFESSGLNQRLSEIENRPDPGNIDQAADIRNRITVQQGLLERTELELQRSFKTANLLDKLFDFWKKTAGSSSPPVPPPLHFQFSFGAGGPFSGGYLRPYGIGHTRQGDLLVADYDNHRVLRFSSQGFYRSHFGGWGNAPGSMKFPVCVQEDCQGFIYVSEERNRRVQKFTADGRFVLSFGDHGQPDHRLGSVFSLSIDPENRVWVADPENNRLAVYDCKGRLIQSIAGGGNSKEELFEPVSVCCLKNGDVLVGDRSEYLLKRLDSKGEWIAGARKENLFCGEIYFLVCDPRHGIFASDFWNNHILRLNNDLEILSPYKHPGKRSGEFGKIGGLSLHGGALMAADYDNCRIQAFTLDD